LISIVVSTTVLLLASSLTGRHEDDAVVNYIGPCGPAVTVSLASSRSSEPVTELTPIALEHHERGRYW
jgi:hypothetical protein